MGIIPAFMEAEGLTPEVKAAVQRAAQSCRTSGAELVEVDLPHWTPPSPPTTSSARPRRSPTSPALTAFATATEEGCANLSDQSSLSRAHGFGAEAKRRQMLGAYLLSSGVYDKYYYAAQKARTLITQDYDAAYAKVDTILMPASPRTAFKFGEISDPTQMYLSDLYTISLNICGNGGISVPLGWARTVSCPFLPSWWALRLRTVSCSRLPAPSSAALPMPPRVRPRFPSRPILPGREASCNEGAFRGPAGLGGRDRHGDPYRAHRTRHQDVLQLQAQPR